MLKKICSAIVLASFALTPIAHAEGEKAKLKGTNCYGSFQKFRCGYIGEVTINEIYEKGWRVIAVVESQDIIHLVIEEQAK
jgi:hypothetical protein